MRFLPALGLAALLAASTVSAQTTFGIKLGVQAATASLDDDTERGLSGDDLDKKARLGFAGGLTADVPLSPVLSFRPEVLYSQKGVRAEGSESEEGLTLSVEQTLDVDYLEVPLLLAYNVMQPSGLAFSVEAGPTISYLLAAGIDTDVECSGDDELCAFFENIAEEGNDLDDDFKDALKSFDLGGALGATVGSGPFHVGVRYTLGLVNIIDDSQGDEDDEAFVFEDDAEWRNSALTASLIYTFGAR